VHLCCRKFYGNHMHILYVCVCVYIYSLTSAESRSCYA
jgi:hypothetical protein